MSIREKLFTRSIIILTFICVFFLSLFSCNYNINNYVESNNKDDVISGDNIILSFSPNKDEAEDLYKSDYGTYSYLLDMTEDGYNITCYVLQTIPITYDNYITLFKGGFIFTPNVFLFGMQCYGERIPEQIKGWYDGYYSDLVIFNKEKYCILRPPSANNPEILRLTSLCFFSYFDYEEKGWTMEFYPVICSKKKKEFHISNKTPVILYIYPGITMTFEEYLANGGDSIDGDNRYQYGFYATIENNEIIKLYEIYSLIDWL